METRIWEPFINLFKTSPTLTIQIFFGIIVLGLFYFNNFNTWTGKEDHFIKSSPPRHFTTWARYISYAILYTLIIESTYFLILVIPEIFKIFAEHLGISLLSNLSDEDFNKYLPVWVLVFYIGILPNTPGLRELELSLRYRLHKRAFIPAEARALVQQFGENPAFFRPDTAEAQKMFENISDVIGSNQSVIRPDNRLEHKWFKLAFLRNKIEKWQGQRVISRFFQTCIKEYQLSQVDFNRLKADLKKYNSKAALTDGETLSPYQIELTERFKLDINREIDKLLMRTYEIICCGILATERMHDKRLKTFKWFGLYPDFKPGIPVFIDIILKSALAVCTVTFIITVVYLSKYSTVGLDANKALSWSVIFTLMVGFCIFGAVLLYRVLSRKSRFGGDNNAGMILIGPLVHRAIATGMGYIIALVVLLIWTSFASAESFYVRLAKIWPWPLIPATTSGFAVYYLSSLKVFRSRWVEGFLQGITTGAAALLACVLAIQDFSNFSTKAFAAYTVLVSGMAGYSIGFIFPQEYRRRVSNFYTGPERRNHSRIALRADSNIIIDNEKYACEIENLSLGGAKLSTGLSKDEGASAILELSGVGQLNGYISRKTADFSCIQFSLNEAMKNSLKNYISTYASAFT